MRKYLPLLSLIPLYLVLRHWQLEYVGYIKDDAYISMRYARNLVEGHGLVFNYGDRLEGYTNFLWVMLLAPARLLGWDMLVWAKQLASFFGVVGIVVTWSIARFLADDGRGEAEWRALPYVWIAAALWAVSPSVVLWSQGALEPTLMACLAGGGTLLGMKLLAADEGDRWLPLALGSALLLALGGLARPDAHAVFLVALPFTLVDAVRRKRWRPWIVWALAFVAVVGPYHAWRLWYFGDPFPNTFYVKAAAGPEVMKLGLDYVKELLGFAANGGIFALVPLAFVTRRKLLPKLWALALVLFFLAYLVKIGSDEMKYYRLFLPVFPFALALAALGLRQLGTGLQLLLARALPRDVAWGVPVALALAAAAVGFSVSWDMNAAKQRWNSNFVRWSERSFQAMGAYVQERSEPGAKIAFQDMGGAPWAGGDLEWIDTIGILNRYVAHRLAEAELNPFMRGARRSRPGGADVVRAVDRDIRDYVLEQEPEWLAFIAYVSKSQRKAFGKKVKRARGDQEEQEDLFFPHVRRNNHAHGIPRDRRFKSHYSYERYWKRNSGYWVVLYRREG